MTIYYLKLFYCLPNKVILNYEIVLDSFEDCLKHHIIVHGLMSNFFSFCYVGILID